MVIASTHTSDRIGARKAAGDLSNAEKRRKVQTGVDEPKVKAVAKKAPVAKRGVAARGKARAKTSVKARTTKKMTPSAEPEATQEVAAPQKPTAPVAKPFIKSRTEPVHALATRATVPGTVHVFGNGDCGQLGLGEDMTERKKPFPMDSLDQQIVDVVSGGLHTMALTLDGKLWSWGCNDQRALGRNGEENVPGLVEGLDGIAITRVACSDSATFALSEDGHVYSWGTFRSAEGIMGFSEETEIQGTPAVINDFREPIVNLCAGVDHALALSASGKVYAWGYGQQGQLGRLIMERRRMHGLTPERIRLQDVHQIGCGSYHSFAITKDGSVYAWGLNNFHQLGLASADGGNAEIVHEPTRVAALKGANIIKIVGGEHHTIALTAEGRLFSFGRSDSHQTGLPFATLVQDTESMQINANSQATEDASAHKKAINLPTQIESIPSIVDFTCGSNHNIAVSQDGKAYTWGFGEMLQLGNGEEEDIAEPTLLRGQKIDGKVVSKVAAGGQHSVVLAA
ncbi:hypothetical protein LPJ66_007851 [Kickxella alabastrina]|uniref:Uncharacterized protein n=1 Tax=Kickxella alabastrina TaxID=61397 RepID=A0ACC1IBI0_9FUNG|nr:hypothetical protein LPJ66_007851 [Kickxella alabastrina]